MERTKPRTAADIFDSLTQGQRDDVVRQVCTESTGNGLNYNSSKVFADRVLHIACLGGAAIICQNSVGLANGKYVGVWYGDQIVIGDIRNDMPIGTPSISLKTTLDAPVSRFLIVSICHHGVTRIVDLVLGQEIGPDGLTTSERERRPDAPRSTTE